MLLPPLILFFFFFNDTATTEIYPLSLHDALPIFGAAARGEVEVEDDGGGHDGHDAGGAAGFPSAPPASDRESTRLNSSHPVISYSVFFLKKKKKKCCMRH